MVTPQIVAKNRIISLDYSMPTVYTSINISDYYTMDKVAILDVDINNLSLQEVVETIKDFMASPQQHFIVTPNPEMLVAAQQDQQFKEVLNYADIAIADGVGLIYTAAWQGKQLQRVTGVDLVWEICELAAERGWSVYLLGGRDGIASTAAERLKQSFTNLKVAGAESGGVIDDPYATYSDIVDHVNQTKPQVLLVAFGQIKQEKWIFSHLDKLPSVKLAIGVGGTFDYLAGTIPRAPKLLRQLGLEWLYRLMQEPQRWKRIITATVIFPLLIIKHKFSRHH